MKLLYLSLFLFFLGCGRCSRILVLYPFGTLSHKLSFYPVIEALGSQGHNVTMVTMFPPKENLPNVKEIVIPHKIDDKDLKIILDLQKVPTAIVTVVTFFKVAEIAENIFNSMMSNTELQDILLKKEVDIIIADGRYNDFCMAIVEELNVPFVLVSANIPTSWHLEALGGSVNLATTPSTFTRYTKEMSFLERVDNVIVHYISLLSRRWILVPKMESFVKKHFPSFTSIVEVEKKASILFTASDPSYSWTRSLGPRIVEIGAVHCRSPKPLPQNLQRIADESSGQGFVVFSLGSLIKSSEMPSHYFQGFLKAFARIPHQVIWKWESDSLEAPPNVHLVKWLPQQDLLGHPNARLFISHGGLLGVQEAVYHGVPVLGLPLANDQYGNIRKLVYEGMALELNWDQLSEQLLFQTITSLTTNTSFKTNAERLSRIMRDSPIAGTQKALYWIDYVLRHNGTRHLQLNDQLPWYQYYLIDVLIFLSLCVFCYSIAVFLLCRKVVRHFSRTSPITKEEKKKEY